MNCQLLPGYNLFTNISLRLMSTVVLGAEEDIAENEMCCENEYDVVRCRQRLCRDRLAP